MVLYGKHKIEVKMNAFVCDAPARAYIAGVKNHTGYFACTKGVTLYLLTDNQITEIEKRDLRLSTTNH